MLNIRIVCVGRLKEGYWRDACAEYIKRLGGYCRVQLAELPEQRLPDQPSPAQVAAALQREGEAILAQLPGRGASAALCVEGRGLSSEELAAWMQQAQLAGASCITFVIGSSHGLSPQVKEGCGLRLSFSRMTFPHQMMRVMLLEQVYRALSIAAGSPYHK